MDEVVHDHMMEWHQGMKMKAEKLKGKLEDDDEHHEKSIPKK
jgi:hypothetical protein